MHPSIPLLRRGIACFALMILTAVVIAACNESSDPPPGNPAPDTEQGEPTGNAQTQATVTPEEPGSDPEPAPTPPNSVEQREPTPTVIEEEPTKPEPAPVEENESEIEPMELPDSAFLEGLTHMYQTFNNCSAASVCMLLSHYDLVMDQEELRPIMRPNDGTRHGKNEYMIDYIQEQGFEAPLMHGGDVETLQAFIAHDIPVIVQQWLDIEADPIGHYSVVRGYDNEAEVFRLNDSMHGEDFHISYQEFTAKWEAFSYRYIPVYPESAQEIVDRILGEEVDPDINRERAAERLLSEIEEHPGDAELLYALGTNLHELGRYDEAIEAYEHAEAIGLPPKMLWYVYWPTEAYNEVGRHEEAIQIAEEQIASAQTFGDMRYERARALEALGETDRAIDEYRQALTDDPKLTRAEEALERLGAQ